MQASPRTRALDRMPALSPMRAFRRTRAGQVTPAGVRSQRRAAQEATTPIAAGGTSAGMARVVSADSPCATPIPIAAAAAAYKANALAPSPAPAAPTTIAASDKHALGGAVAGSGEPRASGTRSAAAGPVTPGLARVGPREASVSHCSTVAPVRNAAGVIAAWPAVRFAPGTETVVPARASQGPAPAVSEATRGSCTPFI
jgi:hypothetical protein